MSILSEFREFAVRGNMVDMAVGIIIGGAFGTIVKSLVSDVIMPPIGLATGGINFSEYKITLAQAAGDKEAVTMNIGVFINNVISFLIVAMAVFLIVKAVNAMRRQQEEAPPAAAEPTATEQLLTEIRDELKKS